MKKYTQTYNYRAKQKELDEYRDKVVKVIKARELSNMSFAEIARATKLPDRTVAFKIYDTNKTDSELKKLATVDN